MKIYFSVNDDNIGWFSTLILNHPSHPDLSALLVHHYYLIGSFKEIKILDVLLTMGCGFNYKGTIGSRKKNRYFSGVDQILRGSKIRRTCLIKMSELCSLSKNYYDLEIVFYNSREEGFSLNVPESVDYVEASMNILPDITEERDDYYRNKRLKFRSDSDSSVDLNSDGDLYLEIPTLTGAPLDDPPTLSEAEEKVHEGNLEWVQENEERITCEYEDLVIAEFERSDINYLNLPFLLSDEVLGIMNDGAESKKMSERFFTFLYGTRIFDKVSDKERNKLFGECMRYIMRRVAEFGGLKMDYIPDEVWAKHSKILVKIQEINETCKQEILNFLNNESYNLKKLEPFLKTKYAEKCIHMTSIKSLYTKYAYIQDVYLGRNTSYMLDIDICDFMTSINYHNNYLKRSSTYLENGLTEYEDGWAPSINEQKEMGRKYYTKSEKKDCARKFSAVHESEFEDKVKKIKGVMGDKWTDMFIENFSTNKIKDEDQRLSELKREYNCMIKTRGKWSEDDNYHFNLLLQQIFELDSDFVKYLPQSLKENLSKGMGKFSNLFLFVNSACTNSPGYIPKKDRGRVVVNERNGSDLLRKLSEITGLDDEFEHSTIKGGVKIKEIDPAKEKRERELREARWRHSKNMAIDKMNEVIETFVEVYGYLGDAVELTPSQFGLSYGCDCKDHLGSYKNALLSSTNPVLKVKGDIVKAKLDLEFRKNEIEKTESRKQFLGNLKPSEVGTSTDVKDNIKNDWVRDKYEIKKKATPEGVIGLETKNRFSCLFDNPEEVEDAKSLSLKFLSHSDNMNIIFNWKEYKRTHKKIRKKIEEKEEIIGGKLDCNALNKIKTNNGHSSLKKYRVTNICDVMTELYLCYQKRIFPDFTYFKKKYGIKRCQSLYLFKGIDFCSKRLLEISATKMKGLSKY